MDERVRQAAESKLTRQLGAEYYSKEVFQQMAEVLEAQTRKRKGVSTELKQVCNRLANLMRGMGK